MKGLDFCPICGEEMQSCGFKYTALGDNSSETATKIFHTIYYKCRNENCKANKMDMEFFGGSTELEQPKAEKRFCRKCGALLAELENGKLIFPPSVTERPLVNSEYHIRCPACGAEEILPAGNTEEPPAQPPAEEPAKEPTEEHAPGA